VTNLSDSAVGRRHRVASARLVIEGCQEAAGVMEHDNVAVAVRDALQRAQPVEGEFEPRGADAVVAAAGTGERVVDAEPGAVCAAGLRESKILVVLERDGRATPAWRQELTQRPVPAR